MESHQSRVHSTLIIILALFSLAGCSRSSQPVGVPSSSLSVISSTTKKTYIYNNYTFQYGVEIPSDFGDKKGNDEKMYFGYADTSVTGDVLISFIADSSPCSPSLTGVSQTTDLPGTGGKTVWGRFADAEMMAVNAYPDQLCHGPPPSEKCADRHEPFQFCDDGSRTYALCSEKAGKTVVICISQQTDNPALAKQIFETFRWTE